MSEHREGWSVSFHPREEARRDLVVTTVKNISQLQRPVKILVTGAEGAGKTKLTLVWDSTSRATSPETTRSPAEEGRDLRIRAQRSSWWRRRPKRFITLIIPPGQIANESRKAVFDTYTLPGRHPDGVIHVVCWGYNTPWRGEDAADVRAAIDTTRAAAAAQQAARLADEQARRTRAEIRRAQEEARHAWAEARRLREELRLARLNAHTTVSTRRRLDGHGSGERQLAAGNAARPRGRQVDARRSRPARHQHIVRVHQGPQVPDRPPPGIDVQGADALTNLRAINLAKELSDFELVCRVLARAWAQRSRSGENFWLVIALAKCDLYEAAAAQRYYAPGDTDERTEFGRVLADLQADVPTLNVVVAPVSAGPEPYGRRLNLGVEVEPILGPDESLATLNRFWAVVEGLCGIR